jgi:putative transposase
MGPTIRHGHLPRLAPEHYQGLAVAHWTMTIQDRRTGWLTPEFHVRCREALLHTMVRYHLVNPAYCLMPDHGHFVWMGVASESDQSLAAEFFRRQTNAILCPLRWQKESYDHVLRENERMRGAFQTVCHYVLENPVRKGLVPAWDGYEFSGAAVPGYPDLQPRRDDYWEVFWKIYNAKVSRSSE